MDAMSFTLNQLRIASNYKTPEEKARIYSREISEAMKNEVFECVKKSKGITADECAKNIGRSTNTAKDYLQNLVRDGRVAMHMQKHNKPAIYKAILDGD